MPHKDMEARREYQRAYRQEHKDHLHALNRAWVEAHPEQAKEYKRRYHEKRKQDMAAFRSANRKAMLEDRYWMTEPQYQAMLDAQGGACAICERPPPDGKALHVDHDHTLGIVRGLLCGKCNRAVGLLCDDLGIVRRAADYLGKHTGGDR